MSTFFWVNLFSVDLFLSRRNHLCLKICHVALTRWNLIGERRRLDATWGTWAAKRGGGGENKSINCLNNFVAETTTECVKDSASTLMKSQLSGKFCTEYCDNLQSVWFPLFDYVCSCSNKSNCLGLILLWKYPKLSRKSVTMIHKHGSSMVATDSDSANVLCVYFDRVGK